MFKIVDVQDAKSGNEAWFILTWETYQRMNVIS